MEYRLIRNVIRGSFLVVGSDGLVSAPLDEVLLGAQADVTQPGWWRVPRQEYNTALWEHPLWTVVARHVDTSAREHSWEQGTFGQDPPTSDGNQSAPSPRLELLAVPAATELQIAPS